MRAILYNRMSKAEKLNDRLRSSVDEFQKSLEQFNDLPGYSGLSLGDVPEIDISEVQKNLMREYEDNPVLYDAIHGKQSVWDTVEELSQINKGIKRFLPRRKNKTHNERLDQVGELVGYPHHLRASGVWVPDNFVGGLAMTTGIAFGVAYFFSKYLLGPAPDANPEEYQQTLHAFQVLMPSLMSGVAGPVVGLGTQLQRSDHLPVEEAKYLDGKVQEFYK